ncbi:hypothetical protein TURU_091919 [Turdus rufiventris]|nr:hypothetical protein TURU_091919 [Turdus rufiventris]
MCLIFGFGSLQCIGISLQLWSNDAIETGIEESRVLRTVPLLAACLPPDKCKILVGRRFNEDRYPELATVCRNPSTLILYPGAEATNLEEVAVMFSTPSVMIIIDGTWSQAKDIFYKNALFRLPKQEEEIRRKKDRKAVEKSIPDSNGVQLIRSLTGSRVETYACLMSWLNYPLVFLHPFPSHDTDKGVKCTHSRFALQAEWDDTPEGCDVIQRNLDKLKK